MQHVLVLELVDTTLVRVVLFVLGVLTGGTDAHHKVALGVHLRLRLHNCVIIHHHVDILFVHVVELPLLF